MYKILILAYLVGSDPVITQQNFEMQGWYKTMKECQNDLLSQHPDQTYKIMREFIEDNNYQVSIETKLSKQLIEEGISREIIHTIQNLRKDSGFNISDKITVSYFGDNEITEVIKKFKDHISKEILSTTLTENKEVAQNNTSLEINSMQISLSIKLS